MHTSTSSKHDNLEADGNSSSVIFNTCLHLALFSGNNRSVELIIMYLAKIKYDATTNFISIIDRLILYKNFKVYLENMSF